MPSLATLGDELLVGVCVLWPIVGADARSISQLPAHDDFRRSALPLRLVNRKLGALATDQAFGVRWRSRDPPDSPSRSPSARPAVT